MRLNDESSEALLDEAVDGCFMVGLSSYSCCCGSDGCSRLNGAVGGGLVRFSS